MPTGSEQALNAQFDLGAWFQGLSASFGPVLGEMGNKYSVELARSLADWTPVLLVLILIAIISAIKSGKASDDFDSEEDDADGGAMGLMFGASGGAKPKLTVRSWNRQVDKYSLATTRATKGREETSMMRKKLEESYSKLQKEEVAASAKAQTAKKGDAAAGKASASTSDKDAKAAPGRVWVLQFQGGRNDVTASGVQQLREEITAVVMSADPARDKVVLKLDSPGGTVTGYGLAGAQLMRLREAGLHLTVAIDQVAASGGYLMACTADRIVCSPFAVIGSIGVVQELPIVYERLKKEGIQFETTTAGKYKRTLTPFKEPTEEDRKKNKDDLQDVLGVFKEFVRSSRPSVDIEEVATGETWLGPLAKEKGLVDDLQTSDSLLLELVRDDHQVLLVSYQKKAGSPLQQALRGAAEAVTDRLRGGSLLPDLTLQSQSLTPPMMRAPPGPMASYNDSWDAMM